MDKQEMIDAAVAVVEERVANALAGRAYGDEYVPSYIIATVLTEAGVISHPDQDVRNDYNRENAARRSLEGKTKRLLDEAVKAGRVLRFSTPDGALPRLDGTMRTLYGQATAYTTQELHDKAVAAVAARQAQQQADREEFAMLVERARTLGMPEPTAVSDTTLLFDLDGVRSLVERLERSGVVIR